MYALFLESVAAEQVRAFAASRRLDEPAKEALLRTCYKHGEDFANLYYFEGDGTYENWWVKMALKDDGHKALDVNLLISWAKTPEGMDFWRIVNRGGR